MNKKVMKLLNPSTGEMECKVCGSKHWANLQRGGHYHKGSWTCQHGCNLEDLEGRLILDTPGPLRPAERR